MTRKTLTTLIVATFAAVALPASADRGKAIAHDGFAFGSEEGGWSLQQQAYPSQNRQAMTLPNGSWVAPAGAAASDPFERIAGDPGWQLKQHKYLYAGGRLAHSQECDHAIRTAARPAPADVERLRQVSPGA